MLCLRLPEEMGGSEIHFDNFLEELLHASQESDPAGIEGGLTVLIPRHSDASEAAYLSIMPHDDSDPGILLGEILVAMIWQLMRHGATAEEIQHTAARAIYFFNQVDVMPQTTGEVEN
jgi:hypothetical protein